MATIFALAAITSLSSPACAEEPPAAYSRAEADPFEVYSFANVQAMVNAIKAEGHPIPTGHPRIFINRRNKEELRQKIAGNPFFLSIMQSAADLAHQNFGVVITDPGSATYDGPEPPSQPVILANAIIYQLGVIPGVDYHGRTPEEYGQDGKRHLLSTLNFKDENGNPIPGGRYILDSHFLGPPLGYDWFYELMDTQERTAIAQMLLTLADPEKRPYHGTGPVVHTPEGPLLLGAVAVAGDGVNDAEAARLISFFHGGLVFGDASRFKLLNFHYEHIFNPKGPGNQGFIYSWEPPFFLMFLEAWYDQTDEDYFKLPFPQAYVFHAVHTNGNLNEFFDTNYNTFMRIERRPWNFHSRYVMPFYEIGLTRTNPTAASLAKNYIYWPYEGLTTRLMYMLLSDPTLQAKSPADLDLPKTALYEGIGSVFSRNGWLDSESTWAWFQGPTWTNIRNGILPNGFLIWKHGGMLAGKRGQFHDYDEGSRNNTMVLYEDGWPDVTHVLPGSGDDSAARALGIRLDEGASPTLLSKDLVGYNEGLRYFEEKEEDYLYAMGDSGKRWQMSKHYLVVDPRTQSYFSAVRLDSWSRQFIWFRTPDNNKPDHFVVFDRVKAPNNTLTPHVLLNFAMNPKIRKQATNEDVGPGVVDNASNRFARVALGGTIFHSVVDYRQGLTLELLDPKAPNSPLSVSVAGKAITVRLGTDAPGKIVSTNADVANLINANSQTNTLIRAFGPFWAYYNKLAAPTNGPVPLTGGSGIWRYEGQGDNRIVATNTVPTDWGGAHGRLFVDTLIPKEPIIVRMGGALTRNIDLFGNLGYENIQVYGSEDDPFNIAQGLYKVQIAPSQKGTYHTFLNVLQATDASVEVPDATALLEGPNLVGAAVAGNIALFSFQEAVLTTGSVVVPAGVSGTYRLLLADLKPYGTYDLTIAGNKSQQTASKTGTLYLSSVALAPGDTIALSLVGFVVTCGDLNGDGKVDIADAVFLAQVIVGSKPPPQPPCIADFNNDGLTNVLDLVLLIKFILGQVNKLSCCGG